MPIEDDLAQISLDLGKTVKLDTGRIINPGPDEFKKILDEAARVLYDEAINATLRLGPLIIEKFDNDEHGHRYGVYIHVGDYK